MNKLLVPLVWLAALPVAASPWTPQQVAERAVRVSHVVEEYQARIRGDEAALEEVEAGTRPSLNFSSTYYHLTPTNSFGVGPSLIQTAVAENYSLGLSLRQLVSDFGKLESSRTASLMQQEVTRLQMLDQQDRVAEAAQVEFQQAALAEELLDVAERTVEARQAALQQSQQQYKAGVVSRYDVLRADTALSEARQQRTDSLRERQQTRIRLFSRLNVAPDADQTLVLEGEGLPELPRENRVLSGDSERSRRDLQAAWQAVAQAEAQVQVAQKLNSPRLEVQSDYAFRNANSIQTAQYWAVGLGLTFPVFDGGVREAKENQAQALVDRFRANYAEQLRQAQVEAGGYWEDLQAAWLDIESTQSAVVSAREAARVSRVRYRNGLNTNPELLDAEATLSNSEGRLRRARRNYLIAMIRWSRSAGLSHAAPEEMSHVQTP